VSEMPKSVLIGPYRFAVTDEQAVADRKAVQDQQKCWGWIEYGQQRIILNPDQSEQHKRVALLHEILHGCEDLSDQGHEHDELIIRQLAAPLLDVLRRNPDLVAYLTEGANA
jgi:hypothetical protein